MKIEDIQKHVTYFSEQLRFQAKHEEEIVVGGTITSIVPPIDEAYPMYILILDDLIGTTHVFAPNTLMDAYPNELKIGNVVFLEGFVNVVSRQINKEKKKDISIFAYGMKDITKVGDTD